MQKVREFCQKLKLLCYSRLLPSISSMFNSHLFVQTSFRQLFSSYVYVEKAAKTTFVQKRCAFNIDEIDTWCGMNSNDNKNLDVFFKNQNKETKKYVVSTVRVVYQMALTGPKLICFWHLEIILIETTTLDLRDVMDNHN